MSSKMILFQTVLERIVLISVLSCTVDATIED